MLNTYQDRGIIKWSAFDALNGFNSMLKEMKYRLGKVDKPTLSEDDFDNMDRKLQQAILENSDITISYYEDGYAKTTFGKIKELDYNKKEIVLATRERISAFDVLRIDLV